MAYIVDRNSPILRGTNGDDQITGGAADQFIFAGDGWDTVNTGINHTSQFVYAGTDHPNRRAGNGLRDDDGPSGVVAFGADDWATGFKFYEAHGFDYHRPAHVDTFQLGKSHLVMPLADDAFVFKFSLINWERNDDGSMSADVRVLRIRTPDTDMFRDGDGQDVIVRFPMRDIPEITWDSQHEKMMELNKLMDEVLF